MPKLEPRPKADTTTATGQALDRARRIGQRRGSVAPAPAAAPAPAEDGLAEFAGEPDAFDQDGSKAAGPEATATHSPAKKATATKRAAKKAVPVKRSATGGAVAAASDAWFADLDDTEDFINCLWYGREGSTKTTSLATAANAAPEGSKVLVVNAEGGLKIKALRKHGIDTSKIKIFPRPDSDDVVTDETLERLFLRVQADLMQDPKSWFAVGFDSLTEINEQLTSSAADARVQKLLNNNVKDVDPNFVDRDDYGVSAKIVRKQLRRWRDLPCHFLVTALERRDVDEDTNSVAYGPAVAPAVATAVLGMVDFAIMVKAADDVKPIRGLTKEGGKYRVKDRLEVLPKVMVEPTFDRILDYFNGSITAEDDPFQASLTVNPADKVGGAEGTTK
jgi:hypothetical protein